MLLKKLLLAGSITAISAVSAHAQLSLTTPAADVLTPAEELNFPAASGSEFIQPISATLSTMGTFPTSTTFVYDLTLPANMVFAEDVVVGDLTADDNAALTVTLSEGGAANTGNVVFLVSTTSSTAQNLFFEGRVEVTGCGDGDLLVEAETEAGELPIDGGSASVAIINDCESALNHNVGPDFENAGDSDDTIVLLPNYDTLSNDVVGIINYYIDNDVVINGDGDILTLDDIDEITFDFVAGDGAGLDDVTIAGQTVLIDGDNTASFSFSGADLANLVSTSGSPSPENIVLTEDGGTEIEVQNLDIVNALVTFESADGEDLMDDEPGAADPLDNLEREGQEFGVFDWNDGRAGRTTSVYRVTGFQPEQTFEYEVEMTNSIFAAPNNVFRGTGTADIVGEFVMTSVGFGPADVPTFGRGDAEFTFEVTETLDVDRLMVRNGISTEFGDGANSSSTLVSNQPNNDDDNTSD